MERNSLEDLNKVLDYNFKNSLTLTTFQLSCPKCNKSYLINPNEIMTSQPKFNCNACSAHFYINYPEYLEQGGGVALLVAQSGNVDLTTGSTTEHDQNKIDSNLPKERHAQLKDSSVLSENELDTPMVPTSSSPWQEKLSQAPATVSELVKCPKCEYVNSILSEECIKCSVILNKAQQVQDFEKDTSASDELKDLWELALDNYEIEKNHQNFIRYSHLEANLSFASAKYNSILSVNPHDDIANKMKKQIIALSTVSINKQDTVVKPVKSIFSLFNLWSFSFLLSLSIIGFGYFFSDYKNLIGVGASALCLIASLKFLSHR